MKQSIFEEDSDLIDQIDYEIDSEIDFLIYGEEDSILLNALKLIAKNQIISFFDKKISKNILLDESHVDMVLNYDIITSVKIAYSSLKDYEISSSCLGDVTGDVRLVNSILRTLAESKVPQQFAGGMLLLYLKLIEGINIG